MLSFEGTMKYLDFQVLQENRKICTRNNYGTIKYLIRTFYFSYFIFNIFVFGINEQNNFNSINGPWEAMKYSEEKSQESFTVNQYLLNSITCQVVLSFGSTEVNKIKLALAFIE
jgi:hypothetical protein